MADENYIETYFDGETGKEGIYIKGKDAVMLDAPEIPLSEDIDLPETENRELIAILKELFHSGGRGGDLRALIDSGSGIKLISAYTPEGAENEQYADHDYTCTEETYSETITTKTTADGVTTTHTQTFLKTVITELFDSSGTQILRVGYNASDGKISGYYGRDNMEIHLSEWRTEYTEYASHLNEDAAAIAWCICKNIEQSDSFIKQKRSYRQGLIDGTDHPGGTPPEEDFEMPMPPKPNVLTFEIKSEGSGPESGTPLTLSKEPVFSFSSGVYLPQPDGSYLHIWIDESYETGSTKGRMVFEAHYADGTVDTSYSTGHRGWGWYYRVGSVIYKTTVVRISKSGINTTMGEFLNGKHTANYRQTFVSSSVSSRMLGWLKNAAVITDIPPDVQITE